MDIIKSEIARMIVNLVLKDPDTFTEQVQKETKSKMDNIVKENISKMGSKTSGQKPDKK